MKEAKKMLRHGSKHEGLIGIVAAEDERKYLWSGSTRQDWLHLYAVAREKAAE